MTKIEKSIELDAPIAECYRYLANLDTLPNYMTFIKKIQRIEKTKTYRATFEIIPGELDECDIVIETLQPENLLAWHSLEAEPLSISCTFIIKPYRLTETYITAILNVTSAVVHKAHGYAAGTHDRLPVQLEESLMQFKRILEKQPAAVKSQAGLSDSGSTQGRDVDVEPEDVTTDYRHLKDKK